MGRIIKILSLLFLVGALAGGVYLVNKNQETRRGATAVNTVVSFLPSSASYKVGQTFPVTVVLNTGSTMDKMQSADIKVDFDRTKMKYVKVTAMSAYELMGGPPVDSGSGPLRFIFLAMGTVESSGVVQVAKIYFEAIGAGVAPVNLNQGEIGIKGQSVPWVINTKNGASYTIAPISTPTPIPPTATPVPPTATPTLRPTATLIPTATPTLKPTATPTVIPTATPTATPTVILNCTDSDGGRIYVVKGTTCLGTACSVDVCNSLGLVEYYCEGNIKKMESYGCMGGAISCSGGLCVPVPTITATPTLKPTATPTTKPTATPTLRPTATLIPTPTPTLKPTATPTLRPTATLVPTATPTTKPTPTPTLKPTATPTLRPTATPTTKPTATPTLKPTATPTLRPTATPTLKPTAIPTLRPIATLIPTATPTLRPTPIPTMVASCLTCQVGVIPKSEGNAINGVSCDNKIDLADFGVWKKEYFEFKYGSKPAGGWRADFNCDNKIDLVDFGIWKTGYFKYKSQVLGGNTVPTNMVTQISCTDTNFSCRTYGVTCVKLLN